MNTQKLLNDADANRTGQRIKLLGFCALLAFSGAALAALAGPPRLPSPPTGETLTRLLAGSTIPLDGAEVFFTDLAWILWAWLVLSLALGLALAVAELVAQGSAIVRSLRALANRLSVPLVRRGVAAAFAVQVISRGVPIAAAQPLPPVETVTEISAGTLHEADQSSTPDSTPGPTYLVRPGDTLWSIAERAYGDGTEYRRLVDANVGRTMPDGEVFSPRGVIKPGWRLIAPDATWGIRDVQGERFYEVRPGDTLSSIAGEVLGDSSRWTDLFDLNCGAATVDGEHVLNDANTIWPGLRLQLPTDDATPEVNPDDSTSAAQPDQPPAGDSAPIELLAAAAPTEIPTLPPADPPTPVQQPDPTPTPLPLVRTPHAFQPVVLDPSDSSPAPTPAAEASDGVQASVASLRASVPQVPVAPLALGGLGLAGLAALGLGVRRRRLRPLPTEPESEVVVQGGFAEAQLAHDLTRGLHGVGSDPVVVLLHRLERFLAERDIDGIDVIAVRHGRSSTTMTLRCGLADQPVLLDVAPIFAETLGGEAEACVSADQDVLLRLLRVRKTRLLPGAENPDGGICLVPLGLLYDRQVYYASWQALGHVLVVSLPGHGSETILTSLVATLTSRRSPDQLRVWMLASARSLPAPLFDLPHLVRVIDPADQAAVAAAVVELRAELEQRARSRPDTDLLFVIPEMTLLGETAASLALLADGAADFGVRLVVGSSDPDQAADSPLLPHLSTRMVLRMQSEEISVALLGVADAAFLGGGGRLLLRLDGREPVELYGYQVANEHLERLVKVMRSAYPAVDAFGEPNGGPPDLPQSAPPGPEEACPPQSAPPSEPQALRSTTVEDPSPAGEPPTDCTPKQDVEPAIQVTCFGSPHVTYRGQVVWPRSGGDAKPWELLLYLACQPSEGVSRAAVVQALWPEDEVEDEGAHRFRQLRYRLRRQLAADVPGASDVDGVCLDRRRLRLDPGVIHSDAQDFLDHIRSARVNPGPDTIDHLERARALYTGDLLEGPDVRRYAWIDERDASGVTLREHFRTLFQNASIKLAELYASAGSADLAIDVYRELTQMDPADDQVWQALFRLHAQRGDRESLVAEEQRLRRSLRELAEELGELPMAHAEEPSRETTDEFKRLLAGLREREPVTA